MHLIEFMSFTDDGCVTKYRVIRWCTHAYVCQHAGLAMETGPLLPTPGQVGSHE